MLNLKKKTLGTAMLAAVAMFLPFNAATQMFGDEAAAPAVVQPVKKAQPVSNRDILANPRRKTRPATVKTGVQTIPELEAKKATKSEVDETKARMDATPAKKLPQLQRPTLDGVKRGHVTMRQVVKPGEKSPDDDALIFVYYTDFSMEQTLSGMVMCSMNFIVLTTLDRSLNNLSFRLKWPKMETSLSFVSVRPNEETYVPYTLVGEGCYTMDKLPNIIVNRCRVKNMTQQECASKIRWLKK